MIPGARRAEMLCPSTPSTPGSAKVVLSRGRGAKTAFNGRRAVIGRRLGGGWAAVTPEGSQSAVKWRNGHWSVEQDDAPVAEQDDAPVAFEEAPLGWLPQDLIVRILKALPTPDTCSALQAARALAAYARGHGALCPFTECHLRDGVPAGLGVRPSRQLAFARYMVLTDIFRCWRLSFWRRFGRSLLAAVVYTSFSCEAHLSQLSDACASLVRGCVFV